MKARQIAGLLAFTAISFAALQPSFQTWVELPSHVAWEAGRAAKLPKLPGLRLSGAGPDGVLLPKVGRTRVSWLLGTLPVKSVLITAQRPRRVALGGQSIGVLLQGDGAVVVGEAPVPTAGGERSSPARAAGIAVGDRIVAVDGRPVRGEEDVVAAVERAGQERRPVAVRVRRGARLSLHRLRPVYDMEVGRYRIGLYLRVGVSGVGTLTFVDPVSHRFAALGHVVLGRDHRPAAAEGAITAATVLGIRAGRRGDPGRKIGVIEVGEELGRVDKNTAVGVMGRFLGSRGGPLVPVATADEVHVGPATLWTVVRGRAVRPFSVRIERILHSSRPTARAFILRVTDPELLRAAGGIVQGMSGSPLVQDGRLVGAVTHVFVNDPSRGFGVFAYWMLAPGRGERVGLGLAQRPERRERAA